MASFGEFSHDNVKRFIQSIGREASGTAREWRDLEVRALFGLTKARCDKLSASTGLPHITSYSNPVKSSLNTGQASKGGAAQAVTIV